MPETNPTSSSEPRAMVSIVNRLRTGLINILLRRIGIGPNESGIFLERSKKNPIPCIDQSPESNLRQLTSSRYKLHMANMPEDIIPSSSIQSLKEPAESSWEAMLLSKRTSIERLLQQGIPRNELRIPLLCPSTLTCS